MSKPEIDFDKLKEFRDLFNQKKNKTNPSTSTDPYFPFRQLIDADDYEEIYPSCGINERPSFRELHEFP